MSKVPTFTFRAKHSTTLPAFAKSLATLSTGRFLHHRSSRSNNALFCDFATVISMTSKLNSTISKLLLRYSTSFEEDYQREIAGGIRPELENLRYERKGLILKNRNKHILLQIHEKSSNSLTLGEEKAITLSIPHFFIKASSVGSVPSRST